MATVVLIADDEGTSRELMSEVLRASGFEVISVAQGRDVLDRARSHQPDVIVLDVMMGPVDGREICRQIRADPELRDTPVVLTSAMDEEDVDWRDSGATAFRRKAANILQLPAFVSRLLGERNLT